MGTQSTHNYVGKCHVAGSAKIDEVNEFIFRYNINLAFITETRPKDSVSDGVVQIPGFAVGARCGAN